MFKDSCSSRDAQKQIKDLLRLINRELGAAPQADPTVTGYRVFAMVDLAGRVLGCVVAQLLAQAYRSPCGALAMQDEMVDEPCSIGVNRMWVRKVKKIKKKE